MARPLSEIDAELTLMRQASTRIAETGQKGKLGELEFTEADLAVVVSRIDQLAAERTAALAEQAESAQGGGFFLTRMVPG